jgi:hypothetical protein
MPAEQTGQTVAGSLSATIIRACPVHQTCPATCSYRQVEELGEIARFTQRPEEGGSA